MIAGDDQLVQDLATQLRERAYGKYRGTVTAVDPATMVVRAIVPAVLADVASGWARPCVPFAGDGFGFAFLPEVGSGVWIEFEGGDTSYPIWSGGFWRDGEVPPDAKEAVRLLSTPSGATIVFDDDAGEIKVTDQHGNTVTLASDGITLERGGMKVVVATASVSVNDGALEVR